MEPSWVAEGKRDDAEAAGGKATDDGTGTTHPSWLEDGKEAERPNPTAAPGEVAPSTDGVRFVLDRPPVGTRCMCCATTVRFNAEGGVNASNQLGNRIALSEIEDSLRQLEVPLHALSLRWASRERRAWFWFFVGLALLFFGIFVSATFGHEEFASAFSVFCMVVGAMVAGLAFITACLLFGFFRCPCCSQYRWTKRRLTGIVQTLNEKHGPRGVTWSLTSEKRAIKTVKQGDKTKVTYSEIVNMESPFHWMLAAGMLVTGSINTISTKLADGETAVGVAGVPAHKFDHPFTQALGMFFGEFLCMVVFRIQTFRAQMQRKDRKDKADPFHPIIFALPACCDMTATSTMYVGLTLTYASVFQMLRGSVVIFTGIMSVLFLKRRLRAFHWFSMFLVLVGTVIVGIASISGGDKTASASNPLLGDLLIVLAQMVVAFQVVVEEKFIAGYNVPAMQVVGWEGTWGFCFLSVVLFIMYWIPDSSKPTGRFEDSIDAGLMIAHSFPLFLAVAGNVLSIAFYNWFGISVTKHMSAAHRMVLDSMRTIVIWGFSLITGRQPFEWLQVIGFVILLSGTVFYNEIVHLPYFSYPDKEESEDEKAQYKKLRNLSIGDDSQEEGGMDALLTPSMGKATFLHEH